MLGRNVVQCDQEEGQRDSTVPCLEAVISPCEGERSQERLLPQGTRTLWGRELSLWICQGRFQGGSWGLQKHTKEGFPHISTYMGMGILLGKMPPP